MATPRPELLNALIQQESGGRNNAISSKGARGLTQVMPATASDPGYGIKPLRNNSPEEYKRFGSDYLGAMLDKYNGDERLALAAYNAGPGAVDKAGGVPKYKETQDYIAKILGAINPIKSAEASETPYKPTPQEWLAEKRKGQGVAATSIKPSPQEWLAAKRAQRQPQQDAQRESNGIGHKASVSARGLLEGAASIPGGLYNISQMTPQYLSKKIGFEVPLKSMDLPPSIDTEQYGGKVADILGFDKPTPDDNIIYPVSKAAGNFVIPSTAMAKLGHGAIRAAGMALGGNAPLTAMSGILAGKTAAEIARQENASPGVQLGADIVGNVLGGNAAGAVNAVGRTAGRTGKALTGMGLEGVAGRTLHRAAGQESPQIADFLSAGTVPTITNPIKGYRPTSSEIAGNPGLSTIMRQTGLDVDSLSALGSRKFDNARAIVKQANRAVGSTEKLAAMKSAGFDKIERIATPMRERNLPVDLSRVEASIDDAIARHAGNKGITDGLEALKKDLPTGNGFNEVYNFKQHIDEMLRGNALSDPKIASMQRAASALKSTKRELADALTATEPGFSDYLKYQAINIKKIGQRETAGKGVENAKLSNPLVSNINGQEEIFPLSANKLSTLLKNEKTLKNLSPAQQKVLKTAEEYARLQSRSNLGMMAGSSTAQNLSVKDAVFNDLMAAGFGEKPNLLGRAAKRAVGTTTNLLSPVLLGKVSAENSAALSKIFTRAELDPSYAAELMKKYGLGHLNFNDAPGRAALRATLTQNQNMSK